MCGGKYCNTQAEINRKAFIEKPFRYLLKRYCGAEKIDTCEKPLPYILMKAKMFESSVIVLLQMA